MSRCDVVGVASQLVPLYILTGQGDVKVVVGWKELRAVPLPGRVKVFFHKAVGYESHG